VNSGSANSVVACGLKKGVHESSNSLTARSVVDRANLPIHDRAALYGKLTEAWGRTGMAEGIERIKRASTAYRVEQEIGRGGMDQNVKPPHPSVRATIAHKAAVTGCPR